jgi:hypothetical protein
VKAAANARADNTAVGAFPRTTLVVPQPLICTDYAEIESKHQARAQTITPACGRVGNGCASGPGFPDFGSMTYAIPSLPLRWQMEIPSSWSARCSGTNRHELPKSTHTLRTIRSGVADRTAARIADAMKGSEGEDGQVVPLHPRRAEPSLAKKPYKN